MGFVGRNARQRKPAGAGFDLAWLVSLVLVVEINEDSGDKYQTLHDVLILDPEPEDRQAIVQHAHNEGSDDRAHHFAGTVCRAGAADEASCDHILAAPAAGGSTPCRR